VVPQLATLVEVVEVQLLEAQMELLLLEAGMVVFQQVSVITLR
jgi:hypothetical protein